MPSSSNLPKSPMIKGIAVAAVALRGEPGERTVLHYPWAGVQRPFGFVARAQHCNALAKVCPSELGASFATSASPPASL